MVTNDLIPFLNPYSSRFGGWEVKLLVSSCYKSSKINGFSFAEHRHMKYSEVIGFGADRYIKAFEMLSNGLNSFDVKDGFDILEAVSTNNYDFYTHFSAIFDPVNLCVFIVLQRSYGQIWKLSLNESIIETFSGFEVNQRYKVDSSGILSSIL